MKKTVSIGIYLSIGINTNGIMLVLSPLLLIIIASVGCLMAFNVTIK
jgi:hypothetical protein